MYINFFCICFDHVKRGKNQPQKQNNVANLQNFSVLP
jgi:hypothetical protein